jgi:hypothetical protein
LFSIIIGDLSLVSQWERADFFPAEAQREISAFFRINLNKIDGSAGLMNSRTQLFMQASGDRFETGHRG